MLDELTIARSRKHIKSFYKAEAEIGRFPERIKPIAIYPNIDTKDRFYTYDELNRIILQYKLALFNPSKYILNDDLKQKYEEKAGKNVLNFSQAKREDFLIGMMKVNFLKRLESSIESFGISMDRTIQKIEKLETKIRDFQNAKLKSLEEALETYQPDEDEIEENEEELEQWQVGKNLKFDLADLDLDTWFADIVS